MRVPRIALAVFGVVLASMVFAGESEKSSISSGSLTTHVYYLASDELGGRGTGSEGIDKAAEYIAKEFAAYGLVPGGDDGSFFQTFDIPMRKEITESCRFEVQGADVTPELRKDVIPMPFSSTGQFEGPVVFAGYGITNEDKKYDDYAGIDVKDKVVLVVRYEPPAWTEENGGMHTDHSQFMTKVFLAKDKGAIAVLIVNPPSAEDEDTLYRFRASGRSGDYGLPLFHVTREFADKLLRAGGLDSYESTYQKLAAKDAHVRTELKGISIKGDPGLAAITTAAKNVIAVLPGEGELAKEYVVFGAHYDHLGTVPPTMRPRLGSATDSEDAEVHNGADDNASGTAGVLELARVYAAGPKPKRSLVFMTFTAEEMGLLGSAHYVANPTIPLENVAAMINLDMIGRLEDDPLEVHGTKSAKEFEELLQKHIKAHDMREPRMLGVGIGPSDHSSFNRKKIPVLFMFTGLHRDYHKPSDDAEKVDYDGEVRVLELVKSISDEIIESAVRPTYQEVASPTRAMRMPRVVMGIMPSYSTGGDEDKPGWAIEGVAPERAAAKAGMKDGDRILSIADQEISGISDYMRVLRKFKPGDEVSVVVQRGAEEVNLTVKLEGR